MEAPVLLIYWIEPFVTGYMNEKSTLLCELTEDIYNCENLECLKENMLGKMGCVGVDRVNVADF